MNGPEKIERLKPPDGHPGAFSFGGNNRHRRLPKRGSTDFRNSSLPLA
jgi:hypothetical protein